MSVISRPRLLGCAVALVLGLGSCGGGHHTTSATTAAAGAGQAPTVRFTGGTVPGTVYLAVGPDPVSLDAYRLSGPLSEAERLTYSPLGLGITGMVANRRDVLINRTCCDSLGFMELLNLAHRGGLPGTVVGAGDAVAIAPDGRLAYVVPGYRGCKCDALLIRPTLHGPDRVVYREPHPRTILAGAWSASDRLAVLVGRNSLNPTRKEIVLDPGTPAQRTIQPGNTTSPQSGLWWGPRGELSWELVGETDRIVIRLPTGQVRSYPLPDLTQTTCWLPNDTVFTFGLLKHTIGTLNPGSGAITTIGRYPSSMAVFVLDCPH